MDSLVHPLIVILEQLYLADPYIVVGHGVNGGGNYWERRLYVDGATQAVCYYYENENGSTFETYPGGTEEYTNPTGGGWWRINGVVHPK